MSYGVHRGAGERVLEGRHVIGLFLGVMLLSGLFFTLGYVMGLHQAEASADDLPGKPEVRSPSKPETAAKRANKNAPAPVPPPAADSRAPANSDWEFYHAGEKGKTDDRLKPSPSTSSPQLQQTSPVFVKAPPPPSAANGNRSSASSSPTMPGNAYSLQVAALHHEVDAIALAKLLQKRKFPAYVVSPHGDKYYRVQVGPYADMKAADAARKDLEGAGFKEPFIRH